MTTIILKIFRNLCEWFMGRVSRWVNRSQLLLSLTGTTICPGDLGAYYLFEAPTPEISLHWPVGLLICKPCQIRNFKHRRKLQNHSLAGLHQESPISGGFVSSGERPWKKARLHCSFCTLSRTPGSSTQRAEMDGSGSRGMPGWGDRGKQHPVVKDADKISKQRHSG